MAERRSLFERILNWLRAGYPEGVPEHDYVALFGILHRSLTPSEVDELARELAGNRGAEVSDDEIRDLIRRSALEEPSGADVRRVAGRLAEGGWPLDVHAAHEGATT
ncbi:MAG TPA: DUF3349 domain-containing protein [Micropruina sp.]|jgi:hypothetical protein|nr:DUF3349 domain-containing protein [Micropruina sp.]